MLEIDVEWRFQQEYALLVLLVVSFHTQQEQQQQQQTTTSKASNEKVFGRCVVFKFFAVGLMA
jgi:hypothetical protein